MTIEIHQPELEILIRQRMATGRFQSVEDVLLQALRGAPEMAEPLGSGKPSGKPGETLEQVFAKVRGLFADGEHDFPRDPSPGRPVDLS